MKRWKNYRFKGVLRKKKTVENFFENRACQRLRTPYNAPPLTRNNGKQAAGSAGSGENLAEKSKNKCLTLRRESVICTPRAAAKNEAALLFNNLSD
uniref:hypothetical protein n=2 Tax=Klebsiella aerogenes TaxID=548 RepID=UPI0037513005